MSDAMLGLSGFQLRLPTFEGPLDVLLQLIERNRLEISEVSLVEITGGFLDHIAAFVDPEPALLAQFLAVASRLLLLKSRALLPRRVAEPEDVEPDDLVSQLRAYQQAKLMAVAFREREELGLRSHTRPFRTDVGPVNVVVVVPPVGHLRRALVRAAARLQREPEVVQLRMQVTIGEMISRLRRATVSLRPVGLNRMLARAQRDEVVAGFVALLALWRQGEVAVRQESHFDEIWFERGSGSAKNSS